MIIIKYTTLLSQFLFAILGLYGIYIFFIDSSFLVAFFILLTLRLSFMMYNIRMKYIDAWIEETKSMVDFVKMKNLNRNTRRKILRKIKKSKANG